MGMGNVVMTYDLVCCERVPTRVCMSMRHMCVCVCVFHSTSASQSAERRAASTLRIR